jgi:hypothetical protein
MNLKPFKPGPLVTVLVFLTALLGFGLNDSVYAKGRPKTTKPHRLKRVIIPLAIQANEEKTLSADVDGDRLADLISVQNEFGSYEVEIDLSTRPGHEITLHGDSGAALGLAVLDENADRNSGIVVATDSPVDPIQLWVGNGDGTFEIKADGPILNKGHGPGTRSGKPTPDLVTASTRHQIDSDIPRSSVNSHPDSDVSVVVSKNWTRE